MKDLRKIETLKNWDKNPRGVDKKDFERLKSQLKKYGQYKPLLVNKDGIVLGGNMRLKAMQDMGIKDVWVSEVDAQTEQKMVEYALSDNDRIGYYEDQALAELVASVPDIDLSEFKVDLGKPVDLEQLLQQFGPEPVEDEAPEVEEGEAVSKLGEIYQLGRHRVMCGDSTDSGSVFILMDNKKANMVFTDPPYGIDVVGDGGNIGGGTKSAPTTKFRKVIGDDTDFDPTFVLNYSDKCFIWGGNYFAHLLPKAGRWFVWDKNRPEGLSLSDCELAWSNIEGVKVKKFKCTWDGYHKEGESGTRVHPNQKPIKLLTDVINEVSNSNDILLDLFLGSGSTLIACEQTNRTCYGMELDPKYVDVIRKRYAKFIGKEDEWETITPAIHP